MIKGKLLCGLHYVNGKYFEHCVGYQLSKKIKSILNLSIE